MRRFAKYSISILGIAFGFVSAAHAQKPAATPKSVALDVPIPVKQKASGLTFPYREDGKLKMFFNIEEMYRTDLDHLQMTNAKIQTFDDDGKPDMTVLLPVSVMDLNTRILTSNQPFLVRRSDFSLVGEKLQLDTAARHGIVKGKVKMIIYNFGDTEKKGPAQ
ncbi:MAG: hypothetical protein WCD79_09900 [Chthoniobacteraceae bacterium]